MTSPEFYQLLEKFDDVKEPGEDAGLSDHIVALCDQVSYATGAAVIVRQRKRWSQGTRLIIETAAAEESEQLLRLLGKSLGNGVGRASSENEEAG